MLSLYILLIKTQKARKYTNFVLEKSILNRLLFLRIHL